MLAAAGIAEETPVRVVHTNNGWQKVMGDITAAQVDASPYFKVSQEEVEYSIWIEKTEEGDFDISMELLVYMFYDHQHILDNGIIPEEKLTSVKSETTRLTV